jgi:hypothetical protein
VAAEVDGSAAAKTAVDAAASKKRRDSLAPKGRFIRSAPFICCGILTVHQAGFVMF